VADPVYFVDLYGKYFANVDLNKLEVKRQD